MNTTKRPISRSIRCPRCGGFGKVDNWYFSPTIRTMVTCPHCKGKPLCQECHGFGEVVIGYAAVLCKCRRIAGKLGVIGSSR